MQEAKFKKGKEVDKKEQRASMIDGGTTSIKCLSWDKSWSSLRNRVQTGVAGARRPEEQGG